jgi:hypothetical protein
MKSLLAEDPNLQHALRVFHSEGTFESHLTISANHLDEIQRFREFCERERCKFVWIELPRGETPSQPMTSRYHRGLLHGILEQVDQLQHQLTKEHFVISRTKVESVALNVGVPVTQSEIDAFPVSSYFEFHIKLQLQPGYNQSDLETICRSHDAHVSRNVLKVSADGFEERFLTRRIYGKGRDDAFHDHEELLSALKEAGFTIMHQVREFAIYDSAIEIDAGWIDHHVDEEETT